MSKAATVRDLCRRWRYIEAKREADVILIGDLEDGDKQIDALCAATTAEQDEIEASLEETEPRGVQDASELLALAIAMTKAEMMHDRLLPVLRMAKKALAWAEEGRS